MAHAGRNTGGSQFFICHSRSNTKHLDRQHTCFGKVYEGLEVIDGFNACVRDFHPSYLMETMLMGINVDRMGMLSFAISAGIGAIGGILITPVCLMQYQKGVPLAIKGIAGAVVGGLGNIWGAMLGGLIMGLLEALSAGVVASYLSDIIVFIVLMLVLFLKPQGLLGKKAS
jgi:hypothetical protein